MVAILNAEAHAKRASLQAKRKAKAKKASAVNPEARAQLVAMAVSYNTASQFIHAVSDMVGYTLAQKEADIVAHIWRDEARKTAKVEGIPTTEEGLVSAYSKAMTTKIKPKHANYGETRPDWTGISGRGQSEKDKKVSYKV